MKHKLLNHPIILTEGAVGLRVSNEFAFTPDKNIMYASLIYSDRGRKILETIYSQYLQVACDYNLPIILMTNTRRVNKNTLDKSDYKDKNVIYDYAQFLREITSKFSCESYIGGIIGCKGNAYTGEGKLSRQVAYDFHSWQVEKFAQANIDFAYAAIMPTLDEIIGMSESFSSFNLPYIMSLMINETGCIIDGHKIDEVINTVDNMSKLNPICYMTNCVHTQILIKALEKNDNEIIRKRFKGIQANAAYATPEELDNSNGIKTSNPIDLANDMLYLHNQYDMKIFGGCCGTNNEHIREIANKFNNNKNGKTD